MKVLCLSFFLFFCAKVYGQAPILQIAVFYEALDPDSVRFVTEKLYPATLKYDKYIAVNLIQSSSIKSESWDLQCQNGGGPQCLANKMHSCILNQRQAKGHETVFSALNCLMHHNNYEDSTLKKCFKKSKINYYRLKECTADEFNGKVPKLDHLPFILFNGQHNKDLERKAVEVSMEEVICHLLGESAPKSCEEFNETE